MNFEFEWDESKARKQPGEAQSLVRDRCSDLSERAFGAHRRPARTYGEVPLDCLGCADAEVYRVVYTWRGESLDSNRQRTESEQG